MMKTVLFINFNTSSGRLEKVVKQIPYAPEDKSIYYIGNLYQYLFDRNSDCFCLKISE